MVFPFVLQTFHFANSLPIYINMIASHILVDLCFCQQSAVLLAAVFCPGAWASSCRGAVYADCAPLPPGASLYIFIYFTYARFVACGLPLLGGSALCMGPLMVVRSYQTLSRQSESSARSIAGYLCEIRCC